MKLKFRILQSFKDKREESGVKHSSIFGVFRDVVLGNTKWFIALFVLIVITSCFSIGIQYALKAIIDVLSVSSPSLTILMANINTCVFLCVLAIGEPILWSISGIMGAHMFSQARGRVRRELFHYVSGQGRTYFENNYTGSLTTKIKTAGDAMDEMLCLSAWSFLPMIVRLIAIGIGLALISPWLSLCIVIGFIIYVMVLRRYGDDISYLEGRFSDARSSTMGKLADALTNHRSMSSYVNRNHEVELARKTISFEEYRHGRSWSRKDFVQLIQDCMVAIVAVMLLGGAFYLWGIGLATLGTTVLITTIVMTLITEARSVADATLNFSKHYGSLSDSMKTIYQPYEMVDSGSSDVPPVSDISFKDVSFSYDGIKKVLQNFNLSISSGQSVGIVGSSGSGKSTVIALLGRYYDCQGSLTIGGEEIRDIRLDSLREAIAVVPQRPEIFARTIMENIRYGNLQASDEEVISAAKLAHAHEFIVDLPNGYQSIAGENGIKLSGGQAQRIAIARAFLKNAPILILDEATSALDSESEYLIHESLETLMRGKTTIAIAHRLSTLKSMDRIVVMRDGMIVEDGTHDALIAIPAGEYRRLWDYQSMV